ncbi:MAG: low molecular weight protein arginine phosphatase [Clostridia bacterium]|nr:low molecular weight protein arginine phosphatase [Clostridia bacterium]
MKIMFVCTGNTCRSAMADGLAKKVVKERKLDIEIYSAGIFAAKGEHASYNSVAIMKEYDVDIVTHTATPIEESNVEEMDLVLCATQKHKMQVISKYPELTGRVYTIKEYAGYDKEDTNIDIQDPWGYDLNMYRTCAAEISYCVDKIVEKCIENMKK